uniref:Metal-dependent hydrolase n=1 Tax=Melanopsichium pennsylvanicum 4 TaxID=1398559 RepID=A0A077R0V6_9BASI|nr:metal-dependent hydrolase [Melanopsichium pennsylvanicum 4]
MITGSSNALDQIRFSNNTASPTIQTRPLAIPGTELASHPLPSPRHHPDIGQIWDENVRRANRRLVDEIELLNRLVFEGQAHHRQQTSFHAFTWPNSDPDDGSDQTWPSNPARLLSSSPISAVSNDTGRSLTSPLSPDSDGSTESNSNEWTFHPNWSFEPSSLDHHNPEYNDSRTTSHPLRESYSNVQAGSINSSSGQWAGQLGAPTYQGPDLHSFAEPQRQQLGLYSCTENSGSPSTPLAIRGFRVSKSYDTSSITAPQLLAKGASTASELTTQLEEWPELTKHGLHIPTQPNPYALYYDAQTQPCYPVELHLTCNGRYGPSPTNKKVELYKTEMCRNWEEKGDCYYKK